MSPTILSIVGIAIVLTIVAVVTIQRRPLRLAPGTFVLTLIGVLIGLSIGALLSVPLKSLPGIYGEWLPLIVNAFIVVLTVYLFFEQREAITKFSQNFVQPLTRLLRSQRINSNRKKNNGDTLIVDTSAIIDGRILEIAKSGFLSGKLVVPNFVLAELQNIADSENTIRREKGRRGLQILNDLKKLPRIFVKTTDDDFPKEKEVDAKLIRLAQKKRSQILTVDYNLNRIAEIRNIKVLNVNELANALRPVVLPGEKMRIKIMQEGKDKGQGVGYLADGTMVVVDEGSHRLGEEVEVEVTRIFQTVAGKMIFAALTKKPALNETAK